MKLPKTLLLAILIYWLMMTVTDMASLYFSPEYSLIEFNWSELWTKRLLIMLWFIFTTCAVFIWYRDHTITSFNWKKSIICLAIAALIWVLVYEVHHTVVQIIAFDLKKSFFHLYTKNLTIYTVYTYFSLFSVVVVANAYYYYLAMMRKKSETTELQLKLVNTELMLYRAQLEPHFLFNSLNSIASLVRLGHREQATNGINRLSKLLRSVVEVSDKQLMPLSWELEFCKHYIALQKFRFGKKLQVTISIENIKHNTLLPVLFIQPLIENAIAHGTLADSESCEILINISQEKEYVVLYSKNQRSVQANTHGSGLGLMNLKDRFTAQFGDDFELITEEMNHYFSIMIRFPLLIKQLNGTGPDEIITTDV